MSKIKSIIITGSGKGLGNEIAKLSSKQKYFHYAITRFNDFDVSDIESIKWISELSNDDDNVELPNALINNAGICIPGSVLTFKKEDFDNQFKTNVLGILNCTQLYAQLCIKNKIPGKIINIASTAGFGERPGYSIYAATKASVVSLSHSMSEELKQYGIKVYCLCPGAFDSQLRRNLFPDDNFENMIKKEDIAKFIMKIVNDEIEFLDNQNIFIRR